MYPGYRPTDLFPQHSNEMTHAPHYSPGFEVPPRMKMDMAGSPGHHGFWPYYGSYGYPYPVAYHGCCPHNQFPDYHGWRPCYAAPAPVYYHGSCPPYLGDYPTHYVPPPHSVENPRYEYDKNDLGDRHCCGCPNHLCLQKDSEKLINGQTQNGQKTSNSMVPSGLKSLPYPVLWIPLGYMMNSEDARSTKSLSMEGEKKGPHEEINRSLEPSVWNGWLPVDLNNLKSLMQGGDAKGTQLQQIEDNRSNSFPMYWMPHKPKQEGKLELKEMNGDQMSVEKPSHPLKILDRQDEKGIPKEPGEEINRSLEPSVWNGWLPVDLNNLKSLMQGGDAKGNQLQQIEDNRSNSFPMYWMPHKPKQEEMNGDQMSVEEPSHPLKILDRQDEKGIPKEPGEGFVNLESEDGSKTVGKRAVKKIIPVKQMGQTEEKGVPKDVEKIISVKQMDQNGEKGVAEEKVTDLPSKHTDSREAKQKYSESNGNGKPSVSKASKLPPVCLRIDPLPSRKKSGTSRSQSPLEKNGKLEKQSTEKSASSSAMQSSIDSNQKNDQSGSKVKTIEVTDGTIKNNNSEEVRIRHQADVSADSREKASSSGIKCQTGKGDQDSSAGENKQVRDVDTGNVTENEHSTGNDQSGDDKSVIGKDGQATNTKESKIQTMYGAPRRAKLSKAEAATVIQSAYRGFEVRRWEVLRKLKEIGKIKEEMINVKSRVQDLVSSNMWRDDKHRMVIGESIMNLLLKLDTMQGLHPSVRDKRKSVAKELVSLQEELDSLTAKNSEESEKKSAESRQAEEKSLSANYDACLQGGEQAEVGRLEQDLSAGSLLNSDTTEPCKIQTDPIMDVNLSSSAAESSELVLRSREGEEEELVLLDHADTDKQYPEPLNEVKEKQNEECDISEDNNLLPLESNELPLLVSAEEKLDPTSELPSLSSSNGGQTAKDEIAEMPSGLLDQDSCAQGSSEGVHIDCEGCIVQSDEPVSDSGPVSQGNEAREFSAEERLPEKLGNKCPDLSLMDHVVQSDEPVSDSGLVSQGNEAREFSAEEQLSEKLGNKCPDLSLMDHVASEVSGKDRELTSGGEMLGSDLEDARNEKDVSDINEATGVKVGGNDISLDDVEMVNTSGLEKEEASEVNKARGDEGPVEDMPTSRMILDVRSDPELKESELSVVEDIIWNKKEVPAEEIERPDVVEETQVLMKDTENCNTGQEITDGNGHGQEIGDDKFKSKESEQTSNNTDIVDFVGDGCSAREELVQDQGEKEFPATTSIPSQTSSGTVTEIDQKRVEENEKLRETVEKLVAAGKEQLTAISSLSGRVKDLEKQLSRKKKLKMRRHSVRV